MRWVLAASLALLLLGLSACEPECVDKYDCRKKGINLICVKSRCEPDPDTPFPVRQQPDGPFGPNEKFDGGGILPFPDGGFLVDGGFDAGNCSSVDVLCDGLDNDCDGYVDVGQPRFLVATPLNPASRWQRFSPIRIDGGVALLSAAIIPFYVTESGLPLSRSPGPGSAVSYGPFGVPSLAVERSGGYRALQTASASVAAQDITLDGTFELQSDGGPVVHYVVERDAGNPLMPTAAAFSDSGTSLYVVRDPTGPPLLVFSDGGGFDPPVPHPTAARISAIRSTGSNVFAFAEHVRTDGGAHFAISYWAGTWPVGTSRTLDAGFDDYALGWRIAGAEDVLVIVDSTGGLVLWDFVDGSVRKLGTGERRLDDPHLAVGDAFLAVGIHAQPQNAGPEHLVAILEDGGVKRLATWWGQNSYYAPAAVTLGERRALVTWGYPGPLGEGHYSLEFCR